MTDRPEDIPADVWARAVRSAWEARIEVAPLIWPKEIKRGRRIKSRGGLITYTIIHYGGDPGTRAIYRWGRGQSSWSTALNGYEEAQAATQADYARLIRSAIRKGSD